LAFASYLLAVAFSAANQAEADRLLAVAKKQAERVWKEYKYLSERPF